MKKNFDFERITEDIGERYDPAAKRGSGLRRKNMDLQVILNEQEEYATSDGKLGKLADLRGANLSGADLSKADLSGADLSKAGLTRANLTGAKGIVYIGFDRRRWVLVCWWKNGKPYFTAGCHKGLSLDEALAHWGSDKYPNKPRGEMYVSAVKFLAGLGEQNG